MRPYTRILPVKEVKTGYCSICSRLALITHEIYMDDTQLKVKVMMHLKHPSGFICKDCAVREAL